MSLYLAPLFLWSRPADCHILCPAPLPPPPPPPPPPPLSALLSRCALQLTGRPTDLSPRATRSSLVAGFTPRVSAHPDRAARPPVPRPAPRVSLRPCDRSSRAASSPCSGALRAGPASAPRSRRPLATTLPGARPRRAALPLRGLRLALLLQVCREFQRGACKRAEQECRYAHPPDQVAVDDGQVTVCMDAVKGRCGREPCRYFHPPSHLQAQLRAPRASPAALVGTGPNPAPP